MPRVSYRRVGSSGGGGGGGGTIDITDFRWNIDLIGARNGANVTYTTPEDFIQASGTYPNVVIRVYWNGVRLRLGASNDYTVSESGGAGTGYDTIVMAVAPKADDQLTADYIVDNP